MRCKHFSRVGKSCGFWPHTFHGPIRLTGALTSSGPSRFQRCNRGRDGHWSIDPRPRLGQLIGAINVSDKLMTKRFLARPRWQGQGLMSEASSAVNDYWFETLERPVLAVSKAVANIPFARISEHSGMRVIRPRSGTKYRAAFRGSLGNHA